MMRDEKNTAVEMLGYEKEILDIIRSNNSPRVICDQLQNYHANDMAAILPKLEKKERLTLYRVMRIEDLAEIMEYADEDADIYLEEMDPKKASNVLEKMEPATAADILKNSDSQYKKAWLEMMDPEIQDAIRMLAAYEEDTIASRMRTNYIAIKRNLSIKEAMRSLIDQASENDNISVIYILDEEGVFYGAVDLKDLIIAREGTKLEDIVETNYPYVYDDEKIEDCLEKIKDYSEESIPVLSEDNHIVGVITSQDVVEVVDDEMGEDYAKLGGLSAEEDLKEPILLSVKKRLPWLVLLMFMGMGVSTVVGLFETVVQKLTLIMAFQSMILDMSGNVGTQSLAVTIRVLMDENLTVREKLHLIGKEMSVGFANGLILCIVSFVVIGLYIMAARHMPVMTAFAISACIGLSLLLAMLISSFVGTAVPIFFNQIGVDPAVASGPLITTLTDLVGVVTYYGLSWVMLVNVLHM